MEIINIKNDTLDIKENILIDFYATWCAPCRMLSPTVEEFASENEDVKVVKIDIDKETKIAGKYGIISIPTLVVIENGEETNRAVGVMNKENIEKLVGVALQGDPQNIK